MLTGIYFISSYFLNYQQLSHPSCINSNTKIKYLNIANIFQLSLRTCLHYVHHADLGLREPTYPPFKNFVKFSKKICFGPSTPTPTNSNIPWNPIRKNFCIHVHIIWKLLISQKTTLSSILTMEYKDKLKSAYWFQLSHWQHSHYCR